jgi:hypothetical protein
MFVHKSRFLKFDALQVWWPQNTQEVAPLLDQAQVVMLWQCPEALVPAFQSLTFHLQEFHTPLIDLSQSEEELSSKLDQLCRRQIRKAQKMNCTVTLNEQVEAARSLINSSIRRLRYRNELSPDQWQDLLPHHDIFVCWWEGNPIAAHAMLRDLPARARMLLSGGEDRANEKFREVVGPANRLLHWHELQYYKSKGVRFYDFGGCDLREDAPEYPITQFKLSFGGQVVKEPLVYLAKNPGLRALLKGTVAFRSLARKVPWPTAWLQAVRSNPTLRKFLP